MSKKVLVTGGTGLVGNNVIRELLNRGDTVRALTRPETPDVAFDGLDVELAPGNLIDLSSVHSALEGIDVVVHSAGVVNIGWSYAGRMRDINVGGTENIARAAQAAGARMVHISTVNTLAVPRKGDPPANEETPFTGDEVPCDYVVTKLEADQVITKAKWDGLDATTVYPGFVIGPYDWKPSSGRMMNGIATRFLPVAPSGGIAISDSRDLAHSIANICDAAPPHDHYIIADHNIPYFDLWKAMARVTGASPPFLKMQAATRYVVGGVCDLWGKVTGTEPEINSAMLAMSKQFHYYDSSRARKELNYRSRPLEETLSDAWEWLKDHGAK